MRHNHSKKMVIDFIQNVCIFTAFINAMHVLYYFFYLVNNALIYVQLYPQSLIIVICQSPYVMYSTKLETYVHFDLFLLFVFWFFIRLSFLHCIIIVFPINWIHTKLASILTPNTNRFNNKRRNGSTIDHCD